MFTDRIFQTATECVQQAATAPAEAVSVSNFFHDLIAHGWSSEEAGEVGARALSVMAAIRVDAGHSLHADFAQPRQPR